MFHLVILFSNSYTNYELLFFIYYCNYYYYYYCYIINKAFLYCILNYKCNCN